MIYSIEFQANTYTPSGQKEPNVATFPEGGFVVSWASYGQDGSDTGAFAQRSEGSPASPSRSAGFPAAIDGPSERACSRSRSGPPASSSRPDASRASWSCVAPRSNGS